MNSSDFYDIYKKNKEPLHDNLLFLFLVVVTCLSALFPDLWVFRNFISVAIIGLVCFIFILVCSFGLFLVKDSLERIKQWAGYYEGHGNPPLHDGDFVMLSNDEYYRVSEREWEKITADGIDILVVFNKYGDVLWRRSNNAIGPFKYRVYIYRTVCVIAALICLFVSLTPFFLTDGMKIIGAIILSSFGAGG